MKQFICIRDYKFKNNKMVKKGEILQSRLKDRWGCYGILYNGEWILDENSVNGRIFFKEVIETTKSELNIHIKALKDYCENRNCNDCLIGRENEFECKLRADIPFKWELLEEKTPQQLKIEELEKTIKEAVKQIRELKEV